jgi:lycopene cyclase domain-containing protein
MPFRWSFRFFSAFIRKRIFRRNGNLCCRLSSSRLSFLFCGMKSSHKSVCGDSIHVTPPAFIFLVCLWKKFYSFSAFPYACVFTYFALTHLVEKDHLFPHQELISSVLIFITLIGGIFYMDRWYTSITFFVTGLFLAYQMLKLRPRYMGRFYFAFLFILVPFFIVNSILTGSFIEEPIVWYNDNENLGIRIGTIPLEDIFYGMLMVLMSITIAEECEARWGS